MLQHWVSRYLTLRSCWWDNCNLDTKTKVKFSQIYLDFMLLTRKLHSKKLKAIHFNWSVNQKLPCWENLFQNHYISEVWYWPGSVNIRDISVWWHHVVRYQPEVKVRRNLPVSTVVQSYVTQCTVYTPTFPPPPLNTQVTCDSNQTKLSTTSLTQSRAHNISPWACLTSTANYPCY